MGGTSAFVQLTSIATGTSAHEHVEWSLPGRRYRRRMSFRAAFGRAGDDTRDRRPCGNATTGFRGVDSVPPNELREPAGWCAMRRACATLRLTPGLRGIADQLRTTLTAIGLQSGAMALSASSLIAFLFLESLLSLLPRSRF